MAATAGGYSATEYGVVGGSALLLAVAVCLYVKRRGKRTGKRARGGRGNGAVGSGRKAFAEAAKGVRVPYHRGFKRRGA